MPDQTGDNVARSKAGTLLVLMSAFIVGSLFLAFTVTLWIAPDSMRSGDSVYAACFIGGVTFGGLTGAFVSQWLWNRYPKASLRVGLIAWIVIGIGLAVLKWTT